MVHGIALPELTIIWTCVHQWLLPSLWDPRRGDRFSDGVQMLSPFCLAGHWARQEACSFKLWWWTKRRTIIIPDVTVFCWSRTNSGEWEICQKTGQLESEVPCRKLWSCSVASGKHWRHYQAVRFFTPRQSRLNYSNHPEVAHWISGFDANHQIFVSSSLNRLATQRNRN